jgi:hypothetical protein
MAENLWISISLPLQEYVHFLFSTDNISGDFCVTELKHFAVRHVLHYIFAAFFCRAHLF